MHPPTESMEEMALNIDIIVLVKTMVMLILSDNSSVTR
jgi:hypothetical protein